jgi:hypothetical protein
MMRGLPGWAVYLITGLGALVLVLFGVCGTLLNNDRYQITSTLGKVEVKLNEIQNSHDKQILEIVKHNERQNHIMEKICVALSMDYKTRMETFKNYPLMTK